MGTFLGKILYKKIAFSLVEPDRQIPFLTNSNEVFFSKLAVLDCLQ